MFLLKELLKGVEIKQIIGATDVQITDVSDDSRKAKKGSLFVAIKGIHFDSHDFIGEAIKKEINAAIVETLPKILSEKVTYVWVNDSREALGIISANFYNNPTRKMKVIGVTGTKGKTTTVYMIYHILAKLGKKAGMVSSIVAKIGNKEIDTGFHVSNPEPLALQNFLSKMAKNGSEYAVLEVTSHGIHQKRIAGIKFDVTVLTNIAPEHLDYHKTFAEYKRVKMTFLNSGKNRVIAPKKTNLKLFPGIFNNLNAESAVKAVSYAGITRQKAVEALKSFELPEGRLEEIHTGQDYKIVVDFAHTPDSLEAALKYLRTQTNNKLISVFGSAGERDHRKRPKMGKVASRYSDIIVLTSEDPRTEDPKSIINEIKAGIKNTNIKVFEIVDRKKAIEKALNLATEGDLVAFLGKGHEKSMNMDGIKETPWSEKEIIKKILNKRTKI